MKPSLSLHQGRFCTVASPKVAPSTLVCVLGTLMAIGFGMLATRILSHSGPAWLPEKLLHLLQQPLWSVAAAGVAYVNAILAFLVALGYGSRAVSLLGYATGWTPVRESEGRCHLVEAEAGFWGLELDLHSGDSSPAGGSLRFSPRNSSDLFFRLDEAAAAAVARLFSPGDLLRLRWIDLPLLAGGPTLLEVAAPLEAELPASGEIDQPSAGTGSPPAATGTHGPSDPEKRHGTDRAA